MSLCNCVMMIRVCLSVCLSCLSSGESSDGNVMFNAGIQVTKLRHMDAEGGQDVYNPL
jgi:hypothetical protein